MYQLFNLPLVTNYGVIIDAQWQAIQATYARNLHSVVEHYKTHTYAAPAHGILIDLINSLGAHEAFDDQAYYRYVQREALGVAQTLGLTSSVARGKVHKNQFFGPEVQELLVTYTQGFDFENALRHWQDLNPVTVLSHPSSDLGIPILNTRMSTTDRGWAVIAIDIPLLMLQYRGFRAHERIFKRAGADTQGLSIQAFLHRWVLPSMCASHLDYAFFNRLKNQYWGLAQTQAKYKHPFYLTNWTDRVDSFHGWLLARLKERSLRFETMMRQVPLITSDSLLEFTRLPDTHRSRQINWALAISRLDLLEWLLDLNAKTPGEQNGAAINSILRHVMLYQNDQVFSSMLPSDLARQVNAQIERFKQYR